MGRIFVLAGAADLAASAVAAHLAVRLPADRLRVVPATGMLLAGLDWRLTGGATEAPRVTATLRLAGGGVLDPGAGDVVFNRCAPPDPAAFAAATATDRDYARAEALAVLRTWLETLPARLINPPGPAGLAGPEFGPLPWLALARRVGLATRGAILACPARAAGRIPAGWRTVAISDAGWISALPAPEADGEEPGPLLPGNTPAFILQPLGGVSCRILACAGATHPPSADPGLRAACLRLATAAGAPLLEAGFGMDEAGEWRFAWASANPGLDNGAASFVADRLIALADGHPS